MARFFFGFLFASLLWAAIAGALYGKGLIELAHDEPAELDDEPALVEQDEVSPKQRKRKRGARANNAANSAPTRAEARPLPQGNATTGDAIDWSGDRNVDMAAGEGQLSGKAIEAGFDSVMGRIRRCLVLVPADGEVTGKLTFGMRVGGDGQPRAVNLSGPAVVTSGESGSCLRQAAQSIRFAKFDGPDMLFKYPITLQ